MNRREFLGAAILGALTASRSPGATRPNRIGVSTYSFWQFQNKELRDVEKCIDLAAEMGFDGVEILHRQMETKHEANDYLQRLKRRAFLNGLDLMGFSTHQTFLRPDKAERRVWQRAQALLLMAKGVPATDIAKLLGVQAYKIEYAHTSSALAEPAYRFVGKRVYTDDDVRRAAKHFGLALGEDLKVAEGGKEAQ